MNLRMATKNILIMGSGGVIGKNLISKLPHKYNVFLFDRKIKNKIKKNNCFIKGDCFKLGDLKKLPSKIDTIFYFIGAKGGPDTQDINNASKYIKLNFESLVFFCDFIMKKKIKKIIFTSTEHVYGDSDTSNKNCADLEPFPKNYYGFSKLLSEKYLYNFYKKTDVSVDILRFPRVVCFNDPGIISKIITSFVKKKPISLKKLKTKFNFIYIDDLISAMKICLLQKNTKFRILNIFNNSPPETLQSIAKKIKNILRLKNKIVLVGKYLNDYNPQELYISTKFTQRSLNWRAKFNFDSIIRKLITFYESKN